MLPAESPPEAFYAWTFAFYPRQKNTVSIKTVQMLLETKRVN